MSKTINPITGEELIRIDAVKKKNESMETFFVDKRAQWNKSSEEISNIVAIDLSVPSSAKDIFEAQAKALTMRQQISDQINYFINRRSKESASLKQLVQEKNWFNVTAVMNNETIIDNKRFPFFDAQRQGGCPPYFDPATKKRIVREPDVYLKWNVPIE